MVDPMAGTELYAHVSARVLGSLRRASAAKKAILDAENLEALEAHKRQTLECFLNSVGRSRRFSPPVKDCGSVQTKKLHIRKVVYETAPGVHVPALVYTRRGQKGKRPGILFLCGHEKSCKMAAEYQTVCQILALHGFLVLCPDVARQGERLDGWGADGKGIFPEATDAHNAAGIAALAFGENPARLFIEDGMAAVSVLAAMPEVDSARLAVTGNSGGGTQSIMLAVADERIAAVAPGTFVSSQEAIFLSGQPQDAEQTWYNTLLPGNALDHDDMLWVISPRPVMLLAAEDDFFPIEGTRATAASAARAYALQGVESRFALYTEKTSHRYTPGMAFAAAGFFARHLEMAPQPADESEVELFPAESLQCFGPGGVLAARPDAATLKARVIPAARCVPAKADFVRRQVRPLPMRLPFIPVVVDESEWEGLGHRQIFWKAEEGIHAVMSLFRAHGSGTDGRCTVFLWHGGTGDCGSEAHKAMIAEACRDGGTAVVCDLAGMGAVRPVEVNGLPLDGEYGTLYHLNMWLMRTGDSLPAMRTRGLLRAVELLREEFGAQAVDVHAEGYYQLYADYAALCAPGSFVPSQSGHGVADLPGLLAPLAPDQLLWHFVLPGILASPQ